MTINKLLFAVPMAAAAIALPASAQINVSVPGNPAATVNANVNADVQGGISSSLNRSATGTTSSKNATSGTAGAKATMSATVNGGANATSSSMGARGATASVMTRADISASSTGTVAPASVSTSEDLTAYVRSAMVFDENVVKVSSSPTEISVWYKQPARLLGIIPMDASVRATVNASGTVDVDHSWWYTVSSQDELKADLETTAGTIARGEMGDIANMGAGATFSASAQARIINAIRSIMRAHYDSSVSGGVGASTSASPTY